MNLKNNFFLRFIFLYFLAFSYAHAFILITEEEAKKYSKLIDSKNYSQPLYKSSSSTPAIELINPNLLSNNLSSPITIELRFITDDVPIALETFKTFYGSLKLDITKRILKKADIKTNSIHIENAKVPKGRHKFIVQISDAIGRVAVREFSVNIK